MLDGRPVKTPAGGAPAVPAEAGAGDAAEWEQQGERIDPATMLLTRLANTITDGVGDRTGRREIVRHLGSDLLCYRADAPEDWCGCRRSWEDLAWARDSLGASCSAKA
jgi:chaperone required for assembly of F1-ATPase